MKTKFIYFKVFKSNLLTLQKALGEIELGHFQFLTHRLIIFNNLPR